MMTITRRLKMKHKVTDGQRQTNIICGGPQPPNNSGMNSKRERKRSTYGLRMKRLNEQNQDYEPDSFTGCLSLTLWPMMDVKAFRLDVNQTFPDREILAMRVAEEASLCSINFICSQSDVRDFECTGYRFCVFAHRSEHWGWHVSTAYVRKGDEFIALDEEYDQLPENATLPSRTKWIVPLILPVIIDTSAISNKNPK